MSFVYRQATYSQPGVYQWVKPPTGVGAGPFGSTYQQTIVTVIGPGCGGDSGGVATQAIVGLAGGDGGTAGGYARATFQPVDLSPLVDITVGSGTVGAAAQQIPGTVATSQASTQAAPATVSSKFGALITCTSGFHLNAGGPGSANVFGGTNITSVNGGTSIIATLAVTPQPSTGPTTLPATWRVTGNNGGGAGGVVDIRLPAPQLGGDGGSINGIGGGQGSTNSGSAGKGLIPGAGGGAAGVLAGLNISPTGGDGASAAPNSGAGGGGGGSAVIMSTSLGGPVRSGAGGRGSDGLVQVTDIFTLPVTPAPYHFNLDVIAWYHMMNQSRPISVTGRYQS